VKKFVTKVWEIDIPDDRSAVEATIDDSYEHKSDADLVKGSDDALAVFISDHDIEVGDLVVNYDVTVSGTPPPIREVVLSFKELTEEVRMNADDFLDFTSKFFSPDEFADGDRTMRYVVQLVDAERLPLNPAEDANPL